MGGQHSWVVNIHGSSTCRKPGSGRTPCCSARGRHGFPSRSRADWLGRLATLRCDAWRGRTGRRWGIWSEVRNRNGGAGRPAPLPISARNPRAKPRRQQVESERPGFEAVALACFGRDAPPCDSCLGIGRRPRRAWTQPRRKVASSPSWIQLSRGAIPKDGRTTPIRSHRCLDVPCSRRLRSTSDEGHLLRRAITACG